MKSLSRSVCVVLVLPFWCVTLTGRARAESILTEWNPIIIDATIRDAPPPTVGTHVMSTIFTAAYDAWSAFDPVARPVYGDPTLKTTGTEADKEEAISHAIYTALSSWTPSNQAAFDAFMAAKGYDSSSDGVYAVLGRTAAQRVFEARMNDGANRANGYADTTGYAPRDPSARDSWQPWREGSAAQKPLTPHWGHVRAFAIERAELYRPPAPAPVDSQRWEAQIQELIDYSANLTDRHKVIAEYWRPQRGTPPMLLAELTADVSRLMGFGLDEDVKLFFAIHNAMFDAGICCWEAKYYYDYARPFNAIRGLGDVTIRAWGGPGKGTVEMPASQWHPYQASYEQTGNINNPTPPFPEYTSGHSTFSSAWAEIMESFAGAKVYGASVTINALVFEQVTLATPVTLDWPTFRSVAEEAGLSRLYGGIHFSDGNLRGQEMGTEVGEAVWRKALEYFHGGSERLRVDLALNGRVDESDLMVLMRFWHQDTSVPYYNPYRP